MVELEEREFVVRVLTVPIKPKILKQLRVIHSPTLARAKEFTFICWFSGQAVLGNEYSAMPYVLTTDSDGQTFLYHPATFGRQGTSILVRNRVVPQGIIL